MNELTELIRIGEFDSLHISLDERGEKNSFTMDIPSISLLAKSLKICYNRVEILFIYQRRGVS